jgi:hypothetical protein
LVLDSEPVDPELQEESVDSVDLTLDIDERREPDDEDDDEDADTESIGAREKHGEQPVGRLSADAVRWNDGRLDGMLGREAEDIGGTDGDAVRLSTGRTEFCDRGDPGGEMGTSATELWSMAVSSGVSVDCSTN